MDGEMDGGGTWAVGMPRSRPAAIRGWSRPATAKAACACRPSPPRRAASARARGGSGRAVRGMRAARAELGLGSRAVSPALQSLLTAVTLRPAPPGGMTLPNACAVVRTVARRST